MIKQEMWIRMINFIDENEYVNLTSLSKRLDVSTSYLVEVSREIESIGLIEKNKDGRFNFIRLTSVGRKIKDSLDKITKIF